MDGAFVTVKMAAKYFACSPQNARIKMREIATLFGLYKLHRGHSVPNIKAITYPIFCQSQNITKAFLEEVIDKK